MDFFVKNKVMIHSTIALSEILDFIIAVIVNLITRENFSLFSTHNLIMCGFLIFCVAAHIICGIIQHNASPKTRNKRFQKAFLDHGGYDVLAEEAKDCIKRRDYRSLKDLTKMVDLLER